MVYVAPPPVTTLARPSVCMPLLQPRPSAGPGALGCMAVTSDGSCNAGDGIAGAWVFLSKYTSDRASLACRCNGSEASELLGIVGAIAHATSLKHLFSSITFLSDSANALAHVFDDKAPVQQSGRDLLPGIRLAQGYLKVLVDDGYTVEHRWVPREQNCAHHVAKREQVYRFGRGWLRVDDCWPGILREQDKAAFFEIARLRGF